MNTYDLKYLQYAVVAARCGSVTEAARKLYMAQPNLSRALRELERSLGFPLFIRNRQGLTATPQGEIFLKEAGKMLDRLELLAKQCQKDAARRIHFSCVPSSLYVNCILEAARKNRDWMFQSEECYDCRDLFDSVEKGRSAAAFLTFGFQMKEQLVSYLKSRSLQYHMISKGPAYGVLKAESPLLHKGEPPSIDYEKALLMLNVDYLEPIGIPFQAEQHALPKVLGFRRGIGRAGNLDMLESMDNLVMLSCHVHSRIRSRNELAAIPYRPEILSYEYGYITKADQSASPWEDELLSLVVDQVRQELKTP